MPVLSLEQIAAVTGERPTVAAAAVAVARAYVPTEKDIKRVKERLAYASSLAASAGVSLPVPGVVNVASVLAMRDTLALAIKGHKALRKNAAIRLARILMIDGHRLILGAATATTVPDSEGERVMAAEPMPEIDVDNDDDDDNR
jgi:hypothetical protein